MRGRGVALAMAAGLLACEVDVDAVPIGGAVACDDDRDCPASLSCDPTNKTCATCEPACAPGQECRVGSCVCSPGSCPSGCCLDNTCVSPSPQNCGISGSSCVQCGGLTPSCQGGLCTADCSDEVVCGNGCCAADSCLAGLSAQACGTSGPCVSCAGSTAGGACVGGACGCLAKEDCPVGQACVLGTCSSSCGAGSPCHGACCGANNTCQAGTSDSVCGPAGDECEDCSAALAGPRCLGERRCGCAAPEDCVGAEAGALCLASSRCGCDGLADCPSGYDCLEQNGEGTCVARGCDGVVATCPNTCCLATGLCNGVQSGAACGTSGGTCVSCDGAPEGPLCIDGACGCASEADCAVGEACIGSTCTTSCDAGSPCNGACCDPGSGTCQPGHDSDACGLPGTLCDLCTGVQTCDDTTRACGATGCGDGAADGDPCVDGCCAAGTCVLGASNTACGADGDACIPCAGQTTCNDETRTCQASGCGTGSSDGDACVSGCCDSGTCVVACADGCCQSGACVDGTNNTACGSNGLGCDTCSGATTCDDAARVCQSTGCGSGTVDADPCVDGCCEGGTCDLGTGNAACGGDGLACTACVGNTTCDDATRQCTAAGCDVIDLCAGSNSCCSAGTCIDETVGCNCNSDLDCVASPDGPACVTTATVNHCGCRTAADCDDVEACGADNFCTTDCDDAHPCKTGCCDGGLLSLPTRLGTCVAGCDDPYVGTFCVTAADPDLCGCINSTHCNSAYHCAVYTCLED